MTKELTHTGGITITEKNDWNFQALYINILSHNSCKHSPPLSISLVSFCYKYTVARREEYLF